MSESICLSCGKCCLATEMILSEQDIRLILDYNERYQNKDDFSFINREGLHQLKNVDGHCYFFNINSNKCAIYNQRPQGCRFYPLIYDHFRKRCILDDDCPNPRILYQDYNQIEAICKSLRKFLKYQIRIHL